MCIVHNKRVIPATGLYPAGFVSSWGFMRKRVFFGGAGAALRRVRVRASGMAPLVFGFVCGWSTPVGS